MWCLSPSQWLLPGGLQWFGTKPYVVWRIKGISDANRPKPIILKVHKKAIFTSEAKFLLQPYSVNRPTGKTQKKKKKKVKEKRLLEGNTVDRDWKHQCLLPWFPHLDSFSSHLPQQVGTAGTLTSKDILFKCEKHQTSAILL